MGSRRLRGRRNPTNVAANPRTKASTRKPNVRRRRAPLDLTASWLIGSFDLPNPRLKPRRSTN
jgi:hypothetical protein